MSDLQEGFVELRCCGESIGFVNARSFTPDLYSLRRPLHLDQGRPCPGGIVLIEPSRSRVTSALPSL
jgi:hypothetical protein